MARAGPTDWESVTIQVPFAAGDERRAVGGLVGRPIRPGTNATRVNLGDLDQALARAGDGWGLQAVVEAVHGRLPDRVGAAQARMAAVADARAAARAAAPDEAWVDRWLDALEGGMAARLHGRGDLGLIVTAARVLAELPCAATPLPVLASRITGDTKALSSTTLAGLVLRGLAHRFGEPRPRTASDQRTLWEAAGVVPDDLASQVLVLNLAVDGGPLGRWLSEAAAEGLPFRATLHQLMRSTLTVAEPGPVYVCENPAVLRSAAEQLGASSRPLVCTEGRPSVACMRLLEFLVGSGCTVHYHGDLDWPGLRIAASVLDATGGVPWRYGAGDYTMAARRSERPAPLRGPAATSPWEPALAIAMADLGRIVYEEEVLESLLADLAPGGHTQHR
jgi:uncharacterized protein (TIGR02679 family)